MKNNKRKYIVDEFGLDIGKVPPQAVEVEEAVLGALLITNDTYYTVEDLLKPEIFYKNSHQLIFKAIKDVVNNKEVIDILTVANQLKKNETLSEVGGPIVISNLTNKVATASHVEFHIKILIDKYIKRKYLNISANIQDKAFDDSIDMADLIEYADKEMLSIHGNINFSEPLPIKDTLPDAYNSINDANQRAQQNKKIGITTGLSKLNEITLGWQDTDLIILGARPSMGKSALAMSFALSATNDNKPVLFVSLEMNAKQLNTRLISGITDYTSTQLRSGKISDMEKVKDAVNILSQNKLIIDDPFNIHIDELCTKARRAKKKHDIRLMIIDYLQLINAGREYIGKRELELALISRKLKNLAKELCVPIIALSQLSRALEKRTNKKPIMSDLRESGAIEQDADIVAFLHRPSYYGEKTIKVENKALTGEMTMEDVSTKNIGMIVIAKHRNGMLDDVLFRHNTGLTIIQDYQFENTELF